MLVTGGTGQVARALALAGGDRVRVVGRPALDFDAPETIAPVLDAAAPSLVINAAAYTAVDRAESEADAAARANATGPGAIAAWCARAGVPLIHLSTDYVFDGLKGAPYVETDATNPTGVYGATKLAGERAVLGSGARAAVLRTSWVYGAGGRNFVLTMLNAARTRDHLRVVADQRGCPTEASALAAAVLAVAERMLGAPHPDQTGVFHACGSGETTWHGLTVALLALAGGHRSPVVEAITTADWPTPARRPPDSRLDTGLLHQVFATRLADWRVDLRRFVAGLAAESRGGDGR